MGWEGGEIKVQNSVATGVGFKMSQHVIIDVYCSTVMAIVQLCGKIVPFGTFYYELTVIYPTNIAGVNLVVGCSKDFFPTAPTPALVFLTQCLVR